jgi:hypothetical protein
MRFSQSFYDSRFTSIELYRLSRRSSTPFQFPVSGYPKVASRQRVTKEPPGNGQWIAQNRRAEPAGPASRIQSWNWLLAAAYFFTSLMKTHLPATTVTVRTIVLTSTFTGSG